MSRNLDNLKRLFQKVQVRYGADDPMVLQLQHEIESREIMESQPPRWFTAHGERRSGKAAHARLGQKSTI